MPSPFPPDPLPVARKNPPSSFSINPPPLDQQQAVKCPRCNSSTTKFCYYNNYSLAQPRHFCKTCRRYWTKGGALRNVPVGGGSRKTKKLRSSSKGFPTNVVVGPKLLDTASPTLDFPLNRFEIPRENAPNTLTRGVYDSQFHVLEGLNFPPKQPSAPSALAGLPDLGGPAISMMTDHNLSSSVESLGRVNQELHWKLQQRRLAALYAVSKPRDTSWSLSTSRPVPRQENIASGTNGAPSAEGGGSTGNSDSGAPWIGGDVSLSPLA